MRSIAFFAAILALSAGRLFGDEFFAAGNTLHPDHLVPIQSFMDDFFGDYDQLLAKHLFVTKGELGRMLVRPSFSPEFCLSVAVEHVEHAAKKDDSSTPSEDPCADPNSRPTEPDKSTPRALTYDPREVT